VPEVVGVEQGREVQQRVRFVVLALESELLSYGLGRLTKFIGFEPGAQEVFLLVIDAQVLHFVVEQVQHVLHVWVEGHIVSGLVNADCRLLLGLGRVLRLIFGSTVYH